MQSLKVPTRIRSWRKRPRSTSEYGHCGMERKSLSLGEFDAAFEHRSVTIPGKISSRFSRSGSRISVCRNTTRRLRRTQKPARLCFPDSDIARRQVEKNFRAGERRRRRRRLRHPDVLADFNVSGERHRCQATETADRRRMVRWYPQHQSRLRECPSQTCTAAPLEFPIVGQIGFRHGAEHCAAKNDDGAVEQLPAAPQRRPDYKRPGKVLAMPRRCRRAPARPDRAARPGTEDRRSRKPKCQARERSSLRSSGRHRGCTRSSVCAMLKAGSPTPMRGTQAATRTNLMAIRREKAHSRPRRPPPWMFIPQPAAYPRRQWSPGVPGARSGNDRRTSPERVVASSQRLIGSGRWQSIRAKSPHIRARA